VYNANRPEVHEVIRHWRQLTDRYPHSVLVGETPVDPMEELAKYYGTGHDELHMAFNFPFISAPFDEVAMRTIVEDTERALPPGAWPVWTGSNHDMSRFATRWAADDPAKTRVAVLMLFCLRGTPVLYQGDEIGQPDTDVPHELMQDPLGVLYWPAYAGRDAMRTPMQWTDGPGAGFTDPGATPWLPFGDVSAFNVDGQRDDPASMLTLTRDLIALRRARPDLREGRYASLSATPGTWAWSRGEDLAVVVGMSDGEGTCAGVSGSVVLATDRRRTGEQVDGVARVQGWEAVVIERSAR
jgi:alpha-glucosidase